MSKDDVDEAILTDIARACNTSIKDIEDVYECTPSQIRMIQEIRPEVYQFVLSFGPSASVERFSEALRRVVDLNAILRTRFAICRLGTLQVVLGADEIPIHHSGDMEQYLQDSRTEGLWIGVPLFRARFIGTKFVATIHHAIMDYWSWFTLFNVDLAAAYYQLEPPTRVPFKDFVAHCKSIDDSEAKAFWAARFRGHPACFPDFGSGGSGEVRKAATRKVSLGRTVSGAVLAQMPYFIEASWAITSSIYTGNDSVAYGYLLSGRSSSSNGLRNTLGPTVIEVPIQVDLKRNMSVEQLIKERALSLRQLQANPAVQCGIHKIIAASTASKHAAAYRTLLNILPELPAAGESEDIKLECMTSIEAPFPLHLIFNINGDGFTIDPRFDPQAISETQLNHALNQFEHVLQLLIESPTKTKLSSLKLLNPHDYQRISSWNGGTAQQSAASIQQAFRVQVREHPDAPAVEDGDMRIEYGMLDQMSDRLAHELQTRGVSRNVAVVMIFERSLWAIVTILGILKAGGACVPIGENEDLADRAAICSRVKAKLVLVSSAEYPKSVGVGPDIYTVNHDAIEPMTTGAPLDTSCQTDTAFILCARNTETESRAFMLQHGSLAVSLVIQAQNLGWQQGCRMLHRTSYASSWSIFEVLGMLLSGGCVSVHSKPGDEMNLSRAIEDSESNWTILSSSELCTVSPSSTPSLENVLCIGERPIPTKVSTMWTRAVRLFRGWGTSETSFISTVLEVPPSSPDTTCVGLPAGCSVWIVNSQNIHDLAPIGSIGELLVAGPGVAKGYFADEAKTAASFVAAPAWAASFSLEDARLYRTGLLGRYDTDGNICLVGRRSNRVQIKGRAVQLEDIERVLLNCDILSDIAILTQISAGRTQIVAVVCLADSVLPSKSMLDPISETSKSVVTRDISTVKNYAKSKLPSDIVPTVWIAVERLPRTDSQALDRGSIRDWVKSTGLKHLV